MNDYLTSNQTYWSRGYEAENVESFIFRPYGRILKWELGLDGSKGEKLLDFGCGQGTALQFFRSKGFDVYGVDISELDINRCEEKMSDIPAHFAVISPQPTADDVFFGGGFDVVTAIQSLYYFDDTDMAVRIESLYRQMKPGGIIYASMMGPGHYMYKHSHPHSNGLSRVEFESSRLVVRNYYVNFTRSEAQLVERFKLFERLHVGYYDARYRDDEGGSFHYTFVGRKAGG